MQGIILEAAEPERLYAFATYVATLVARGEPVAVFVTGRAVRAFSKNARRPDCPSPWTGARSCPTPRSWAT